MGAVATCCAEREQHRPSAHSASEDIAAKRASLRNNSRSLKRPPLASDESPSLPRALALAALAGALVWRTPPAGPSWIPSSPAAMLAVLALVWVVVTMIWHKLMLYLLGVTIMFFGRDKRWRDIPDPASSANIFEAGNVQRKRVIFIRHGESAWNEVFNRGILWLPFGLIKGVLREILCLPSRDSVFLDSPLNREGVQQARDLARFLESKHGDAAASEALRRDLASLRGEPDAPKVALCCSNLRRAMQTIVFGLRPRLDPRRKSTGDDRPAPLQVSILSSLQEVTTNVDGIAIAEQGTVDALEMLTQERVGFEAYEVFDGSENAGQKGIRAKGVDRLREFSEWVFKRPESVVIAAGHSFYFRYFFRTYLPRGSKHAGKTKKMANGGIVAFTLEKAVSRDGLEVVYRIDEDTITNVYLGFSGK